jgi:hypothetical protein
VLFPFYISVCVHVALLSYIYYGSANIFEIRMLIDSIQLLKNKIQFANSFPIIWINDSVQLPYILIVVYQGLF